jgi:hypothetical protein
MTHLVTNTLNDAPTEYRAELWFSHILACA